MAIKDSHCQTFDGGSEPGQVTERLVQSDRSRIWVSNLANSRLSVIRV